MHMSDALITPIIGGSMWAASMGGMTYASKRLEEWVLDERMPYMGVAGAFVFASQMINFAIPGTGSSGHIGGGMLLAILLGPHAGFLTMAGILLIQALFFADGGLLAFGCNLINLGFFTSYIAYPFIYKPIVKMGSKSPDKKQSYIILAAVIASIVGLQLGALGVVIETVLSGRTDLPFTTFLAFMQPIHLAIGLVEGVITASVAGYLFNQRSEMHYDIFSEKQKEAGKSAVTTASIRTAVIGLAIVTLLVGGGLSHFASSSPDGLEWSIEKTEVDGAEPSISKGLTHELMERFQEKVAILPDYGFKVPASAAAPAIGTSVSGVVGSVLMLVFAGLVGI
jgi:cobalt/nickel transport system permease protein